MTVPKQKVAEKKAEPRRYNTKGADKVQKKAPEDENMTVCKQKEAEKEKEAEPRTDNTEGQCLTICTNAKFLQNTQHKCRICKQTVSQMCSCNVKDQQSDNPQYRIHKKNGKALKLFECTKCGKTSISKEALECHMRTTQRPDLDLKKCTDCEELFDTKNDVQKHVHKYHITNNDTPTVPEITKRRKHNLDEIKVEDKEFVNTEELLRSDDDYDPQDDTMDSESKEGSGNEGYQLSIQKKV